MILKVAGMGRKPREDLADGDVERRRINELSNNMRRLKVDQ